MTSIDKVIPFLGDIENLTAEITMGRDSYICPALTNLGSVSLVLLREAVAPVVFRGLEPEISGIELTSCGEDGSQDVVNHICGGPQKFSFKERQRGLQIERAMGVGGKLPQNKTIISDGKSPGDYLGMNAMVFGDSASYYEGAKERPLAVKKGVMFGNAVSIQSYAGSVMSTFHNRGNESGTLHDDQEKKSSDNLFTNHWIKPGTILVQTGVANGRQIAIEHLRHLLLCLGGGGTYGGRTSMTGTNIRTHVVGIYASRVERTNTVAEEIVKCIRDAEIKGIDALRKTIHDLAAPGHEVAIPGGVVEAEIARLQEALVTNADWLKSDYANAAVKTSALFNAWFQKTVAGDAKKGRGKAKAA